MLLFSTAGVLAYAGLPVGMQLIGRPWAEADLLYTGSVLEKALQGTLTPPQVFCDVMESSASLSYP